MLAKATQDVQGQLGTYDLYYLDQSWVATFAPDCVDPVELYKSKPDLAMPGFDWDDFSEPLVEGLAKYDGKLVGIPFDIPIFVLMYRQDLLEKHGIKVPTNYEEFTAAAHIDQRGGEGQRHLRHRPAGQVRPLFAGMRLDPGGVGPWRLDLRPDKKFTGNDEQGVKGLEWYQDLLTIAPPQSTASTWDGQFQMMQAGQVALVQSWDEFFPGLDADDSKVKGLWQPAKPLQSAAGLRKTVGCRASARSRISAIRAARSWACRPIPRTRKRPGSSCSGPAARRS